MTAVTNQLLHPRSQRKPSYKIMEEWRSLKRTKCNFHWKKTSLSKIFILLHMDPAAYYLLNDHWTTSISQCHFSCPRCRPSSRRTIGWTSCSPTPWCRYQNVVRRKIGVLDGIECSSVQNTIFVSLGFMSGNLWFPASTTIFFLTVSTILR